MTSTDVAEAIANLLAKRWPDRLIYRDFCPDDFERPSFFLWQTKTISKDINIALVEWDVELRLEIFCSTDHYDISSTEELSQAQMDVLGLFGAPKLAVVDRFVTVEARGDGQDAGSAFIVFNAKWVGQRAGMVTPEQESMANYKLRYVAEEREITT